MARRQPPPPAPEAAADQAADDALTGDDPVVDPAPLPGRLPPLAIVLVALAVTAATVALTVRPGQGGGVPPWLYLGGPYLLLAAYSVYLMYDDGSLLDRLSPRGGDFTLGVLVAAALLFGSWGLRANLAPAGTAAQGWVSQIYLVLGAPNVIQRSALLTLALLLIAATNELVWRGMVQDALAALVGPRHGWIATACLFTLASLPTAYTLSDVAAGPNPLVLVAAGACGLVWSFLTRVVVRLWPAIFSHMAFLYFTAVQFQIPGLTPNQ